jgi:hypothetical protein
VWKGKDAAIVAHGELFVFEKLVEAGADFAGFFLCLVDVVADGAALSVEVSAGRPFISAWCSLTTHESSPSQEPDC